MNIDTITVLHILKWNNKAVVTVTITMLAAIFQFPGITACIQFSVHVKYQINKCIVIIINKKLVLTIISCAHKVSISSSKHKELLQILHFVPKTNG